MRTIEFWGSLILAIVAAFVIAIFVPGKPDEKVRLAIEYGGLVITFLFGFMILAGIASGKIDISRILEEKGAADEHGPGGASMSGSSSTSRIRAGFISRRDHRREQAVDQTP